MTLGANRCQLTRPRPPKRSLTPLFRRTTQVVQDPRARTDPNGFPGNEAISTGTESVDPRSGPAVISMGVTSGSHPCAA